MSQLNPNDSHEYTRKIPNLKFAINIKADCVRVTVELYHDRFDRLSRRRAGHQEDRHPGQEHQLGHDPPPLLVRILTGHIPRLDWHFPIRRSS